MAWGRRCDVGCASWPDEEQYAVCPVCGEETIRFSNLTPMTQSQANHTEFEAYYVDHCLGLNQTLDGPLVGEAQPSDNSESLWAREPLG